MQVSCDAGQLRCRRLPSRQPSRGLVSVATHTVSADQLTVVTHTVSAKQLTVFHPQSTALCRLPQVQRQFAEMQAAGFPPTTRTFNSLLDACKRSGNSGLAHTYLHHEMPAAGVEPDVISWNALLGAYGRNGHVDGAYATWQVCCPSCSAPTAATATSTARTPRGRCAVPPACSTSAAGV